MFDVLTDLLLPSRCVGCPRPDGPLCGRCRASLARPRLHRPDPAPPGLPALAVAADYSGPVRAAVLAYKERSRRGLARALGVGLAAAVREVLAAQPGEVRLVPVPSAAAVARRRGGQHVERLAAQAAQVLRAGGMRASVVCVLTTGRGHPDAAMLTAAERSRTASGRFRADLRRLAPRSAGPAHWVVVDDVVTTGSTLAGACRALEDAGVTALSAAAVAATRRWRTILEAEHGRSSQPAGETGVTRTRQVSSTLAEITPE